MFQSVQIKLTQLNPPASFTGHFSVGLCRRKNRVFLNPERCMCACFVPWAFETQRDEKNTQNNSLLGRQHEGCLKMTQTTFRLVHCEICIFLILSKQCLTHFFTLSGYIFGFCWFNPRATFLSQNDPGICGYSVSDPGVTVCVFIS